MEGDYVDRETCLGVIDCGEFIVQPFNYVDSLDNAEALNPSVNIFFEVLSKIHKQLLASRIYELMNLGVETPTGRFEFTNDFESTQGSLVKYMCFGKLQPPQFQGMPSYYYCDSIFEICSSSGITEEHLIPYKSYILGDGKEVHVHVKPKDEDDEGEMLLNFQQYSEVRVTLKDDAFLDQEVENVSSTEYYQSVDEEDEIEAALAAMGFPDGEDQTPQAE